MQVEPTLTPLHERAKEMLSKIRERVNKKSPPTICTLTTTRVDKLIKTRHKSHTKFLSSLHLSLSLSYTHTRTPFTPSCSPIILHLFLLSLSHSLDKVITTCISLHVLATALQEEHKSIVMTCFSQETITLQEV